MRRLPDFVILLRATKQTIIEFNKHHITGGEMKSKIQRAVDVYEGQTELFNA